MLGIGIGLTGAVGERNPSSPALDLNFSVGLDPRVTFTRASTGTYFGSDGLLKTANTNLMLASRDFNAGAWSRSDCSATRNKVAADGTANAATLITEGSTGLAALTQGVTVPSGAQAASSIDIKRGNTDWIRFTIYSSSGNVIAWFNLATGTLGSTAFTAPATGSPIRSITPIGNGFYRITVSGALTGMTTYTTEIVSAPGDNAYTRVNGAQYIIDRAQIELGSTFTTFAETGAAQNAAPRFDYDPSAPAGTTGPELAGPLAAPNYTAGATTTFSNGVATTSGTSAFSSLLTRNGFNYTPGKTYFISVNATKVSGNSVAFQVGPQNVLLNVGVNVGTQTYWSYFVANNTGLLGAIEGNNSTWVGSINSITVREVVFAPRGLLIEEARTNLALFSRDLTNGVWGKNAATATLNQIGIDGSLNSASLLVPDTTSAIHRVVQSITVVSGTTYSTSVVAKASGYRYLYMNAVASGMGAATFDLQTGTVANTASGSASVQSLGGGWYRCTIVGTASVTGATVFLQVNNSTAASDTTYIGDGTSGIIFDAAQCEAGAFASSIIPTTSAAVTRAADNAQMTGANFSSWFNQTAGTFVVESDTSNLANTPITFCIGLNSEGFNSNSAGASRWWNGATNLAASGSSSVNVARKEGFAYTSGSPTSAVTLNGTTPITDTNVPWTNTPDKVVFGASYPMTTQFLNGHIRRLSYYNTRLPDATLQNLTK